MRNQLKKFGVVLVSCMFSSLAFSQSITVQADKDVPKDKVAPAEAVSLPAFIITPDAKRYSKTEKILLDQKDDGAITITLADDSVLEKHVFEVPVLDNFGYYFLKKLLKDIDLKLDAQWEKYGAYMRSKEDAYGRGKKVQLKFLPISEILVGKNKMEFLLFPYFRKYSNGDVVSGYSGCIRITKGKAKPVEKFVYEDDFKKWLLEALKYQLSLNK